MNTFVVALLVFAATNVLGQNPYEYVDDGLINKVGQIVYDYDKQTGLSRGSTVNSNIAATRGVTGYPGRSLSSYDLGRTMATGSYVPPYQQQQWYNNQYQRSYAQPQQPWYNNQYQYRNQRQLGYNTPAQYPLTRTLQNNYQSPVYPYQSAQVKNTGLGYTLSQPEVIPKVAEFHDKLGSQNAGTGSVPVAYSGRVSGYPSVQSNGKVTGYSGLKSSAAGYRLA